MSNDGGISAPRSTSHLPALDVFSLQTPKQSPYVVPRLPLVQQFLEHLHPRAGGLDGRLDAGNLQLGEGGLGGGGGGGSTIGSKVRVGSEGEEASKKELQDRPRSILRHERWLARLNAVDLPRRRCVGATRQGRLGRGTDTGTSKKIYAE